MRDSSFVSVQNLYRREPVHGLAQRCLCVLVMAMSMLSPSGELRGQGTSSVLFGGGLTTSESMRVRGGHVLVGGTHDLSRSFRIDGDAFLAFGEPLGIGNETIGGGSLGIVWRRRRDGITPVAGIGLGYHQTSRSSEEPLSFGLGVVYKAGVEMDFFGHRGFFYASPRVFGNVFRQHGATRSLLLLTLGISS